MPRDTLHRHLPVPSLEEAGEASIILKPQDRKHEKEQKIKVIVSCREEAMKEKAAGFSPPEC